MVFIISYKAEIKLEGLMYLILRELELLKMISQMIEDQLIITTTGDSIMFMGRTTAIDYYERIVNEIDKIFE